MHLPGQMDARVIGLSVGICLLVTLIVGIIPAFQTRHLDVAGPLKSDSSSVPEPGVEPGCALLWSSSR